jgi:hypothetical protein
VTRYQQLNQLSDQVDQVRLAVERLTGHVEAINQRDGITDRLLADYENRLRALERWRYALPTSVLAAMVSAVVAIVAAVHP